MSVMHVKRLAVGVALTLAMAGTSAPLTGTVGPNGAIGGLTARFVDVNGVKARYYEAGQGEPMVLIHGGSTGGSSTANVWSRNIPGLAKRFHVFAVDRLGSGLSGNPANHEYGTPAQVQFIHDFVKALKLGPLHLVGHSAGGAIAFYLAIDHPAMFKTLTIVAHGPQNPPAASGPTRLEAALKKCPDQTVYDGLKCRVEALAWTPTTFDAEYWEADTFMATQPKSKEARTKVAAAQRDPQYAQQNAAYRERAWNRVRNDGALQLPVLMYAGKNDVLDWGVDEPVSMLRGVLGLFDIIGARNANVSMIVVNEGGHFMYREHPEKFNNDLISFVDFWKNRPAGGSKTQHLSLAR